MGDSHDRIVSLKRRFIESLARDRMHPEDGGAVEVLLALADARSGLGRWIRGDVADPPGQGSVASFVFVGGDALLFLGDIPSYPGLVVLVVTKDSGRNNLVELGGCGGVSTWVIDGSFVV